MDSYVAVIARSPRSNPFFLYAAKWIASLALAMTARLFEALRIRIDQRPFRDKLRDLVLRKSGLAKNFAAMLPETRRIVPDRGRRLAPGRRGSGDAQSALGR